jgi:hypothetical protein
MAARHLGLLHGWRCQDAACSGRKYSVAVQLAVEVGRAPRSLRSLVRPPLNGCIVRRIWPEMAELEIGRWNVQQDGALTEHALRQKYLPAWHHRISIYRYEVGAKFEGTARSNDLYVLEGRCRISWREDECVLDALDLVTCPAGDFQFEVLGDRRCVVVQVWLLPPEFRVPPEETV